MSVGVTIPLAGGEGDRQSGQTGDHDTRNKTCTSCRSSKPLVDFAVDRSVPGGRRNMCSACRARYDRERYRDRTPGEIDYKRRARKYGMKIVLDRFRRVDMINRYGNACVYCRGPFEATDHVLCVAAGGPHTLENVVPCCESCNIRKFWSVDRYLINIYRTRALRNIESAA